MASHEDNPLKDLYEQSMDWVRKGQTRKALSSLFKLFRLNPCHKESLEAASNLMSLLKDTEGADLIKKLSQNPQNPDLLYQAGFHFIEMGRPDVAKGFLEACLHQVGSHPDVLYELGFCYYKDGNYNRALEMLRKASKDLNLERATSAELLMIECMLYAGRIEEGQDLLNRAREEYQAWGRGDTVDALELMYARHRLIKDKLPWPLRTWHFIQHGGIILAQSQKTQSKGCFGSLAMNNLAVGGILRLLKALIEGLEIRLDAVLHAGGSSLPLALAAGSLLGRPVRHWDQRSCHEEMLVLPNMQTLETAGIHPFKREECAYLFCFQVFPFHGYPLLPDIIGLMAKYFRFPWQSRVELIQEGKATTQVQDIPADMRDPEVVATELADAARLLPEDKKASKLVSFYKKYKDLVVCCNPDRFPARRVFYPQIPG